MRSAATTLALGAIGAYQRFVSPYKGFHCAHHACTGGMTCSNFGKQAIRDHGFPGALPRIRERLIQCSQYATDPRKGKINEDDPGPLSFSGCGTGKAKDRHEAANEDCLKIGMIELGCNSCLIFGS